MPTSRPPRFGTLLWLVLAVSAGGVGTAPAHAEPPPHGAGISILASDVGHDFAVEDLLAFIDEARIRDVIVDWAWITFHWERSNFVEIERFVKQLEKRGIRVAAMYRPRFHAVEADRYDVPYQVDAQGKPRSGYCQIRYADAKARRWGTAWAVEILKRCPSFDEVVVYNPSHGCQSDEVRSARKADPDLDVACVRTFLAETRAALRRVRRGARLGLVLPPSKALYDPYAAVVDVVRPFVFVKEGADFEGDWRKARRVRGAAEGAGPALAKITWGSEDRVTDERLAAFIRVARKAKQPFVFWTFWTTFGKGWYDLDVLCRALGLDAQRIRPLIQALGGQSGLPWDPADVRRAVLEAAADTSQDGYRRMREVGRRYGEDAVGLLCELLDDDSETEQTRWRAGSALGVVGSPDALDCLLEHSRDRSSVVRWTCAEALGTCGVGSKRARTRLAEIADADPAWRPDPEGGERIYYVRETAKQALERLDGLEPDGAAAVSKGLALVAVKDFMRVDNPGAAVSDLEFPRYSPKVDAEQIVLARWVAARTDDLEPVSIELAGAAADPQQNLIHTWRLERMPARTGVVVEVTTLVLRRERPRPKGAFAILPPERYPAEVRPFLRSTQAVDFEHPEVRAAAAKILDRTQDAYEVAAAVASLMRGNVHETPRALVPDLPTSVSVLRHGGTCCVSAVTAAALLRACGIPAQVTFVPAGYIHGILQFHLDGYGWCRMDSTCGVGRLPLVEERSHRGYVRLYDLPIETEAFRHAFVWPYQHWTMDRRYEFKSAGTAVPGIRFASRDAVEARREGRTSGWVDEPMPHLVSGSWNRVLAIESWAIDEATWTKLAISSRHAARKDGAGWFPVVCRLLRSDAGPAWRRTQEERLREFGELTCNAEGLRGK